MSETEKQRQGQKYSADVHIAEIYDRIETQTDDVELIRHLIGSRNGLNVFEPFCGTGRIAIPLARDGHHLTVLDESDGMLERLRQKLQAQPQGVRDRIRIVRSHVFAAPWPAELDLVLLGGNCFYEVNSSDEQRALIHRAAAALATGGHVFIDNDDHQSSELSPKWRTPPGRPQRAFPSGTCEDGTRLEATTETAWYDVPCRLVHYIRRLRVSYTDGRTDQREWRETCRPVVMAEILDWLATAGLSVEQTFGDRTAAPYGPSSPRAVIWARKD